MSRPEGFQTCPNCKTASLPRIDPDSHATATRCQSCGAVIERGQADLTSEPSGPAAIQNQKKGSI